jgi:hypothetical protein
VSGTQAQHNSEYTAEVTDVPAAAGAGLAPPSDTNEYTAEVTDVPARGAVSHVKLGKRHPEPPSLLTMILATALVGVLLWGLLLGFLAVVRHYGFPPAASQVGMFVFGLIAVAAVQALRDYAVSFGQDDEPIMRAP